MSICRVNKSNNYTVMSNYHLRDKNLSLKAKGLLSVVLSLPDEWDYSINGLVAICNEGKTSITSTLNELKQKGYLRVDKLYPNETKSGLIEYVYTFYEFMQDAPQGQQNQDTENLCLDGVGIENPPQLNTNKSNTERLSKDNIYSPLTPQGEKAAEEKPKPKKEKVDKDAPLVSLCKAYSTDPDVQALLLEWLDVRKQKRAVKSVNAIQRNLATLKDMAQQSGMSVKQYLEEVVRRGWQAFYVVPNYGNNQQKRLPTEDDYCDLWG